MTINDLFGRLYRVRAGFTLRLVKILITKAIGLFIDVINNVALLWLSLSRKKNQVIETKFCKNVNMHR